MRDNKYRSWDNRYKDFAYFENGKYIGSTSKAAMRARFNWDNAEQYTGLIDKNGKDIYEGDIVKLNYQEDISFKIVYEKCMFSLESSTELGYIERCLLKIIGNIHKNKELLK